MPVRPVDAPFGLGDSVRECVPICLLQGNSFHSAVFEDDTTPIELNLRQDVGPHPLTVAAFARRLLVGPPGGGLLVTPTDFGTIIF